MTGMRSWMGRTSSLALGDDDGVGVRSRSHGCARTRRGGEREQLVAGAVKYIAVFRRPLRPLVEPVRWHPATLRAPVMAGP